MKYLILAEQRSGSLLLQNLIDPGGDATVINSLQDLDKQTSPFAYNYRVHAVDYAEMDMYFDKESVQSFTDMMRYDPDRNIIYCRRQNTLKQAISLAYAHLTKTYHIESGESDTRPPPMTFPEFGDTVAECLYHIARERAYWIELTKNFPQLQIINYEGDLENPTAWQSLPVAIVDRPPRVLSTWRKELDDIYWQIITGESE